MTAPPEVHGLNELIEACGIVAREFTFQVSRLSTQVTPRNDEERAWFEKLRKGYEESAYWTQVLQRYTVSRRTKKEESPYKEPA